MTAAKARLGFIGTGTIAAAIIEGLAASGTERILVSPRGADIAADLAARFAHVEIAQDNQAVVDHSEIVLIAVRPQIADAVLTPLRFRPDHQLISLIATVSLAQLRGWTSPAHRMVRAVPLPPVAHCQAPTAIFPPDADARALFNRLGSAIELSQERDFDRFTAATATMASFFAFAHSIASWMEHGGIESDKARTFVAQMIKGLAHTAILEPHPSFAKLAEDHQTAGGINEQIYRAVTRNGIMPDLTAALDAVAARLNQTN